MHHQSAHFFDSKIFKNLEKQCFGKKKQKLSCNFAFSSSCSYKIEFISSFLISFLIFLLGLLLIFFAIMRFFNFDTNWLNGLHHWMLTEPIKKCMYLNQSVKYVEIAKQIYVSNFRFGNTNIHRKSTSNDRPITLFRLSD